MIIDNFDEMLEQSRSQPLVMGIALKTLTNYCNHLVSAEPNEEFLAMAAAS